MRKVLSCAMSIIILFILSTTTVLAENGAVISAPMSTELDQAVSHESYAAYLESHSADNIPLEEQTIEAVNFNNASGAVQVENNYNGFSGSAVICGENSEISWDVAVQNNGFYNVLIEYYPTEGKGSTIERKVLINGNVPFENAGAVQFSRIWENDGKIEMDERGNEIRPLQIETPAWSSSYIKDANGFYLEPYSFYFNKGINTFSLVAVKEPMAISKIVFTSYEMPKSYKDYISECKSKGYKEVSASVTIPKIQGEDATCKSNSTLYPISDRSSPLTEPYDASKIRFNSVGGTNWKQSGQWISWEVDVPESGLYRIGFKYRQNITSGLTVIRSLKIDNEYPFKEAMEIPFSYGEWKNTVVGGDEVYYFYLEKGKRTITLEVTLGEELGSILEQVEESVLKLNEIYRQILVVVGSSPDSYRDYELDKKTPEAIDSLNEQHKVLSQINKSLKAYAKDSKGMNSSALVQLITQTEKMYTDPDTIIKMWSNFKDNIVSLSSWRLSMQEQPLEIDYLEVLPGDQTMPRADANFIQKLVHEFKAYIASFTEDYSSLGSVYGEEAPKVWVIADSSGRDQAQIIKNMVDSQFTPTTNIPINVQLVNSGSLLPSVLAKTGPDVVLHSSGSDPVNYAIRNASADLTQFSDFEEVASQFFDASLIPFKYNSGVYGLPETMGFFVMFYRADILNELGLGVPQTWDEFYDAVAVIQKNNLDVGLPVGSSGNLMLTYSMLLMQRGESLYAKDGQTANLGTDNAISAFETWTSLFCDYKLPVTYDFANRFRTGEMPLAIQDISSFNYLSVFAPEIKGQWGFTLVPGTMNESGELDRTSPCVVSSTMIMETSKNKNNSWSFVKWWLSSDVQQEYGNNLENLLGVAGRLSTSNKETLGMLPWSDKDLKVLNAQLEFVKGIEEVPGGYFTSRHLNNAFYAVYNNNENPREVLEKYALTINQEIKNKRVEFNLPVKENKE